MNREKMANYLIELRKGKDLSQASLAELMGVTFQAVSKWERSEAIPDITILEQLSKLYGVTIDEIINGHGNHIKIVLHKDGSITINYSEGDSETIGIPEAIEQGLITIQPENADIDNKKATITYKDGTSTAEINLTVTDPIVSIEVTKNPTKTEYNSGDTIEFEGGTIEATTKSGKKISDISMTEANVTKPITMADINSCSGDKWQNGDKEAGKQIITITYEGKQATFDITVNDTIASIAVKTQPTAKNKYGTGKFCVFVISFGS